MGLLNIRPVPSTSTGPSVREMVLGSEGRLGIICRRTIHVQRLPKQRTILGYLFPTWSASVAADARHRRERGRAVGHGEADPEETAFSFATKKASTLLDKVQSKALQLFLTKRKGFDIEQMCLGFIGYEGSERFVGAQRKAVGRIVSHHGGICIGSSPGELNNQKKFDTPYIRDYLLDRGILADVSETAAPGASSRRSTPRRPPPPATPSESSASRAT